MVAKKSTPKINQTTATIQNYGTAVMINRFPFALLSVAFVAVVAFVAISDARGEDPKRISGAQIAAMRMEYHAIKAMRADETRQQMGIYREQLELKKDVQMRQLVELYGQAYTARQQLSIVQAQAGYTAAMHAAANRPVASTEILNPRTEIMQGGTNQIINATEDNLLINAFRNR